MRAFAATAACLLVGCGFTVAGSEQPDALGADGAADAPAPFACVPWAALNVDPCATTLTDPVGITLAVGTHVLDTDTGNLTSNGGSPVAMPGGLVAQSAGPMVRAVNARSLSIVSGATLSIVGSRPVIIVVHGTVTIDGVIDASARLESPGPISVAGPGGNDAALCTTAAGQDGADTTLASAGGGGGGAGGAFGANGGDGADGHGSGHGTKGSKGTSTGVPTLLPLRGGCPGGSGGDDGVVAVDEGGRRGDGGGGLEITARAGVTINGRLVANGTSGAAGGGVAMVRAGGGGGGSGGAIVLDGDTVQVQASAALCANGGAAGEGGQVGMVSSPGAAPTCTDNRALGGATEADGGDGGDGGATAGAAGTNGSAGASNAGGGGGGGGVGRIRIRGRSQAASINGAAVVSPAPTS